MARTADYHDIAETRRNSDSAVFWVLVLAGSLLIHLIFLLAAHLVLKQTTSTQMQPAPISVEMLDPTAGGFSQPSNSSVNPASPKITSAQSSAGSANRSIGGSINSSTNGSTNPVAQEPSPTQDGIVLKSNGKNAEDGQRSPTSPPQSVANPPRSTTTAAANQPVSSSGDTSNSPSSNQSTLSAANTAPSGTNSLSDPEAPPAGPVKSGVGLPGVPSVPNPADNRGADQQMQPVTPPFQIGRNPVPATFSAQVKLITSTAEPDTLNHPATIQGERSKTFSSDVSGCLLTPAAFRTFKQPVVLKVPLNAGGEIDNPQSISVQQSSGNRSYDSLAICALKSWDFEPAYNLQDGTKIYKPSSLDVEIVITQR